MMDFTKRNQELKSLREELSGIQERFIHLNDGLKADAEAVFQLSWRQKFPNNNCRAIGSTDNNSAIVYLYTITWHNPAKGFSEAISFLESGAWGIQDPYDSYGYGVPSAGPFPFEEFLKGVAEIEAEHPGLKIDLAELKVREIVDPNNITSFAGIRLLHHKSRVEFISKDEKYYTGWDIPDKIIFVKINGEVWVWWSTDGHGGPLAHSAKEGTPEYEKFEEWYTFRG